VKSEEEVLRKLIDGAIRCGVYVPRAAAQMIERARFNDLKRRVDELEKKGAGAKL